MDMNPRSGNDIPHGLLRHLLWLGLLLGPVVLAGCKPAATAAPVAVVPQVTVVPAVAQEVTDFRTFTGTLQASEIVQLQSRVYGYLQDITFKDGDFVQKGQELFKIEPDEYIAVNNQSISKIAIVEAQLELARAKHARNALLVKSNAVSQEEFEESAAYVKVEEAALTSAKADLQRTELDVKYTTVIAPISGRIDRTLVTRGNFVTGGSSATGGTHLTTIVKEEPIFVYFDVDEPTLLSYRRLGRAADAEVKASPGSLRELNVPCFVQLSDDTGFPHQGYLDFASNQSDAGTGTIQIRGVLPNKDRLLTSGLFVRVRVPMGKPYSAILIPEEAIALDQDQRYVYVVGTDNIPQRRDVQLGRSIGKLRLVLNGLKADEMVVTKGIQRVRPGQAVDPNKNPPPQLPAELNLTPEPVEQEETPPAAAEPAEKTAEAVPPAETEEK